MKAFEHALRVNYHDLHGREGRSREAGSDRGRGNQKYPSRRHDRANAATAKEEDSMDWDAEDWSGHDQASQGADDEAGEEEDCVSDQGASADDEIYAAHVTFTDARKKLQGLQKSRGFFKGEVTFEERKAAISKDDSDQVRQMRSYGPLGWRR